MPHRLQTFGTLELRDSDGRPLEVRSDTSRALPLLVLLAARRAEEPVTRNEILALLWPDRSPSRARSAFGITLGELRRGLSGSPVEKRGREQYRLDRSRVQADVDVFRRALKEGDLQTALRAYGGSFLEESSLPDCPPFRQWVADRRGRFRRDAYRAALSLGRRAVQEMDWKSAEDAFRRGVDIDPLGEDAVRGLMEALGEQERREEAVAVYRDYRARRRADGEPTPHWELERLADRIRSGAAQEEEARGEAVHTTSPPSGGEMLRLAAILAVILAIWAGLWHWIH